MTDEADRTDQAATLSSVLAILRTEASALAALGETMATQGDALHRACALIRGTVGDDLPGRLIATGVGKAGIIARKLAATFSSTGTPALFLHPTDARHGDLGMVQERDVVLALSNSGSSEELVALLPSLSLIGTPVIAVIGNAGSPLARHATVALIFGAVSEACPLGLAPSTSTTVMLALGDALALTVQGQRRFTPENYARFHPGGALGRRLMTCREAMRSGDRVPAVSRETSVLDCLRAITSARSGSVVVIDGRRRLLGIFTDGDLRRVLTRATDPAAVLAATVGEHATMPCRAVQAEALVHHAMHLCAELKIDELPVIEADGTLAGLVDLQDLVDRGFAV